MRCALCFKPLPQRDNRTRNVELPYKGLKYGNARAHKDCAGVYKEYTNLIDKQKRDKIEFETIKARIAKAAGHEVPKEKKPLGWDFQKLDRGETIKFIQENTFGTKHEIYPRPHPFPTIKGHVADFVITDDIECDMKYDKELLIKMWSEINDNRLKEALHGTNAATEKDGERNKPIGTYNGY